MRTPQEIEAHLEDVLSALSDSQEHAQIVRLERRTQELRDELTKAKATHHMTDYEKGRAAGLAEAVKVAEAYVAAYSAQIKRLQDSLPPRAGPERTAILDDIAHDSGLMETAVEIAKSLRALSTSPGEPQWTYGHCKEKAKPEGCQLHNLHCGYPDCDLRAMLSAEKE